MANDNKPRASLRGRGWQILTGKSAPKKETPETNDAEIIGQVEVSKDEVEALLEVAPPALGMHDTPSPDAPAQMSKMSSGTLTPDADDEDAAGRVGNILRNISDTMLKRIGGSRYDNIPDFAHHHVDEDSLPAQQEQLDYETVRPRREGEVLNPPPPIKSKRATHEALPVIEARRATQTIDLAQAKLNRPELNDITPDEPETFG